MNTTKEIKLSNCICFDVETNNDNYKYYPYLDSLQWFDTYNQRLTADEESGEDILKLDRTDGESNTMLHTCENCGNEMYEEERIYIETEGVDVCEHCAIWCEERDEYILTDDAIYNSHTGTYHYRGDLDI